MFIAERIRIHRTIHTALDQSKKLKEETPSSVQEAFKQLSQLHLDLCSFNQKHPLFSKLVWFIDRLFAFYPLKKEMTRLKKLIPKVNRAVPFVAPLPMPSHPLELELLDALQVRLFKQRGSRQDHIVIDLLHFIMQSLHALHQFDTAFQKAQDLKMMPQTPAVQNAYEQQILFRNVIASLLKHLDEGHAADAESAQFQKQALMRWNELKLPLLALKVLLENHPAGNPFDPVIQAIGAVENCLDEKIILSRRFLEKRIRYLHGQYRAEKKNLKKQFPDYQEMVYLVIRTRIRSYKKLIRLYTTAHLALNYSKEIADLSICKHNPDDWYKGEDYHEFIWMCSEGKVASSVVFLHYAAETLEKIRAHGRVSLQCRKQLHDVLQKAGVQARLRLHTPLT